MFEEDGDAESQSPELDDSGERNPSQAAQLIATVTPKLSLSRTPEGKPYARIRLESHIEIHGVVAAASVSFCSTAISVLLRGRLSPEQSTRQFRISALWLDLIARQNPYLFGSGARERTTTWIWLTTDGRRSSSAKIVGALWKSQKSVSDESKGCCLYRLRCEKAISTICANFSISRMMKIGCCLSLTFSMRSSPLGHMQCWDFTERQVAQRRPPPRSLADG
jgi:hypothetical protein